MIHLQLSVTKRGTIHLCKIGILFKNRDFEHDVYELIKAFYPEAEIHTLYEMVKQSMTSASVWNGIMTVIS